MIRLAIACALAGCAGHGASADAGDTFIAFNPAFQPFRTWTSLHDDGPAPGTFPPDVLGPRTQYINHVPPHGSTEFPVGTIIVEVRESGTMKIFSGVKRGGGFNAGGAKDWEWFELSEMAGAGSEVSIVWRGFGPPNGDTYGGDTNTCNSCHTACGGSNDDVCSPELQLASF